MSEEQAHPKPNNLLPVLATAINGNELAHGRFEDCKVAIWDYANPEHFNSLWKSLEDGSAKNARRVLIVWTKTPTDELLVPVNTVDHVSPVHWAACAAKNLSQIKVCVLDTNPSAHRHEYIYKHYLSCDKSRLAWLRVVQAAHFFGEQNSSGEFQPDTNPVDLKTIEGRFFQVLQFSPEKLVIEPASFCDHIREKLTSPSSPDDRHAITNIIGPLVLLNGNEIGNRFEANSCYIEDGVPPHRLSPQGETVESNSAATDETPQLAQPFQIESHSANHRFALNVVFSAIKLLPQTPRQCEAARNNQKEQEDAISLTKSRIATILTSLRLGAKLRVTLVDDQWHHGWYEWIKSLLPEKTVFTVCPDPEFLFQKIDSAKASDSDLRFQFDLSPPGSKAGENYADVLFLDLRLFSGSAAAEVEFYKKLLPLCRRFEEDNANKTVNSNQNSNKRENPVIHRAWKGFTTDELKSVENWIADVNNRSEANYFVCLSLLPRLLALLDMALPIVIFSSTGQAAITKELAHYGNITCSFLKPRFFVEAGTLVSSDIAGRLETVLGRVVELLNGRLFAQRLHTNFILHPVKPAGSLPQKSDQTPDQEWHVEICLDETGDSISSRGLTVGGILAVYPPGQSPISLDASLNNKFPEIRRSKDFSRKSSNEIAAFLADECARRNIHIGIVCLSGSTDDSVFSDLDSSDELHDERVADNLHRELLRCVIEAGIYYFARKFIPIGARTSMSVRAPTRTMPPPKDAKKADEFCARLEDEWGVLTERVGPFARMFDAVDALRNIPRDPYGEELKTNAKLFLAEFDRLVREGQVEVPPSLIKYFNFDSARSLVEEVMREYRDTPFSPVARVVRAFPLNSHGRPASMRIPAIHFYTDAVLGDASSQTAMSDLRSHGFSGRYGQELQILLNGHRLLCCSMPTEALACLDHPAVSIATVGNSANLNNLLIAEIAESLLTIAGREFCDLVGMLSAQPIAPSSKPQYRKGRVSAKHNDFCFIKDHTGRGFFCHWKSCPEFNNLRNGQEVYFVGVRDRILGRYYVVELRLAVP